MLTDYPMNVKTLIYGVLLAIGPFAAVSQAEDWPLWRGPRGDGTSSEQKIPTQCSETDNRSAKGLP